LAGENRAVIQNKLLLLDCDSTLSAIEGIDELARLRGASTFAEVERMTRAAMEGGLAMEEIFARRLELIQPRVEEVEAVGALYIAQIEPTAISALHEIREAGWTPIIVSGGFAQAIRPLATHLEIARVEAVTLEFDATGLFTGFAADSPTARSRGKNEVAQRLKREFTPQRTVMVGDGASDLEVQGDVDFVVGFGGYAVREKVKLGADAFIHRLSELPTLLQKWI
jgi:phosphoserine phosphatase